MYASIWCVEVHFDDGAMNATAVVGQSVFGTALPRMNL